MGRGSLVCRPDDRVSLIDEAEEYSLTGVVTIDEDEDRIRTGIFERPGGRPRVVDGNDKSSARESMDNVYGSEATDES